MVQECVRPEDELHSKIQKLTGLDTRKMFCIQLDRNIVNIQLFVYVYHQPTTKESCLRLRLLAMNECMIRVRATTIYS